MNTNISTIDGQSQLFAVLGDVTRLEILNVLIDNPDICVTELANRLDLSISAVSQQCKLLQLNGLLRRVRRGQRVCYQIRQDDPAIRRIIKIVQGVDE